MSRSVGGRVRNIRVANTAFECFIKSVINPAVPWNVADSVHILLSGSLDFSDNDELLNHQKAAKEMDEGLWLIKEAK
ncbi:hypothetical protein N7494_009432 [Penicillium frequentans]|uniref:Uncharacterized protein n=1 Tax=Penicillium frequentans TaxID=3151616 RepID=A0AAD6GBJ7_9EURO|nr:hypothetical protein N7494_009432 [Penicillium glabrum]